MSRSSHKSGVNPTSLSFDEPITGVPKTPEAVGWKFIALCVVVFVAVMCAIFALAEKCPPAPGERRPYTPIGH